MDPQRPMQATRPQLPPSPLFLSKNAGSSPVQAAAIATAPANPPSTMTQRPRRIG
jgi:hypothetical protein